MRLEVLTPTDTALVLDDVRDLRAEDPTGELGIRPRHDDLVTTLVPGVLRCVAAGGAVTFVAISGGALVVDRARDLVRVVAHDAAVGADLDELERTALRLYRRREEAERSAAVGVARLGTALVQRMGELVRPGPVVARPRPAPEAP